MPEITTSDPTPGQMITLCYIACCKAQSYLPVNIKKGIRDSLEKYREVLGPLDIIWGPAVHSSPLFTDALIYIVRDRAKNYIVVVRGTNPISLWSWFADDFQVRKQVPWQQVPAGAGWLSSLRRFTWGSSPAALEKVPALSRGSYNCLIKHINLKHGPLLRRLPVKKFLQKYIRDINKLYIIGHSLGGVIGPCFALWLHEQLPDLRKKKTEIHAFAGPTGGNQLFAAHFEKTLSGNSQWSCYRYHNTYDIAPLIWHEQDIQQLPGLYASQEIKPDFVEKEIIEYACDAVKAAGYQQIKFGIPFQTKIVTKKKYQKYFSQVVYQHIFPYLCKYQYTEKQADAFIHFLLKRSFDLVMETQQKKFNRKLGRVVRRRAARRSTKTRK